jgi:hypothetical protein
MAESTSTLNTPILWINNYLQEKLAGELEIAIPFFPPRPFTIDDLTEQWIIINRDTIPVKVPTAGLGATWDRLIRMRKSPFPHIKTEQALYYFYAFEEGREEYMVRMTEAILRLMDREDETAEEINSWSKGRTFEGMSNQFYFHKFKIYQLQEARDIIDFGTARTYGGNKIIIEFEYHQKGIGRDGSIGINPGS